MGIKSVIFMGTPQFAVPTLKLLANTRFKPILCITQPDRPKGRKRKLAPPEVKLAAQNLKIPVIQPEDVNEQDVLSYLEELKPDVIVTVAYGGYLKKKIRLLPKFGCLNLHPSLLPKYRGSSPINYTLFNGDKFTGNSIFRITANMDAGPILHQTKIPVQDKQNYSDLYQLMSETGAGEILKVLEDLDSGNYSETKQNHKEASFTSKIEKEDTFIDWNHSAENIRNKIRGLALIPGVIASFRDKRLKIIEVEIKESKSSFEPGYIIEVIKKEGILVSTLDFDLLITKVQPAGKNIMSAYDYNLGARIKEGEFFLNGF